MKLALILNIINPSPSGVLIRGEKGTAKSTVVRALADILPEIEVVRGCPYQHAPDGKHDVCTNYVHEECREAVINNQNIDIARRGINVIELPVGATEDRVVGTMDMEHALKKGEKRVEPGIFCESWKTASKLLADAINAAIAVYPEVTISNELLYETASYCLDVGVAGHRGDIIIMKTAKTLAAYNDRQDVLKEDVDSAAELALPHRIRRQPLQDIVVDVKNMRNKLGSRN